VCDQFEEARVVALHSGERKQVICTDGTLIQRSGSISGGGLQQLQMRAKKWDMKDIESWKIRREAIQKDLDEFEKNMSSDKTREKDSALKAEIQHKKVRINAIE